MSKKVRLVTQKVEEVSQDHDKFELLMDIVIRQDQKIHELSNKITELQARSMKSNIIVNSIKE